MRPLRALLLGAAAAGALAYATATTIALGVAASGGEIELALGPVVAVVVERLPDGDTATTLGPGLLVVSVVAGIVNAAMAVVLGRRSQRSR